MDTLMNILMAILIVGVMVVGIHRLISKLLTHSHKRHFQSLRDYLYLLEEAWKIIRNNKWIIWIPWGIAVVAAILSRAIWLHYMRAMVGDRNFISFNFPLAGIWKHPEAFLYVLKDTLGRLLSFNPTPLTTFFIFLPLSVLFIVGFFKVFPTLRSVSQHKKFYQVLCVVTLLVSISLVLVWFSSLSNSALARRNFAVFFFYTFPIYYWGLIFTTLMCILIFSRLLNKMKTSFLLQKFPRLYYFYGMLFTLSFVFFIGFVFLPRMLFESLPASPYYSPLIHIPLQLVFGALYFTPLIILSEEIGIKEAIEKNFNFWHRNFAEIVIFFLIIFFPTAIVEILFASLSQVVRGFGVRYLYAWSFNRAAMLGVETMIGAIIAVSGMLLFLKLEEKNE